MFANIINNPNLLGGNRGVLSVAGQLLEQDRRFALALVTSTKGSTYRKPGALALCVEGGISESVISGGCLESNWHKIAGEVISSGIPQSLLFDTQSDDDLLFGSGSGCRGSMRVLVVPVSKQDPHPLYTAIIDAHERHQTLRLAVVVNGLGCAQGMVWSGTETRHFTDYKSQLHRLQVATNGEHEIEMVDGHIATAALLDISPAPRVLLIGASVETPYLIRMVRMLGWFATAVDHRPAQLDKHAAEADCIVALKPAAALARHGASLFDAALIMSHSATTDLEALRILAERNEPYVGLLGPPARRDELMSQLSDGQRASLLPRLHAPLGLRLGGNGPEPLALSIAAELQRVFHDE